MHTAWLFSVLKKILLLTPTLSFITAIFCSVKLFGILLNIFPFLYSLELHFLFFEMKLLSHPQTQIPSSGSGLHLITFDNEQESIGSLLFSWIIDLMTNDLFQGQGLIHERIEIFPKQPKISSEKYRSLHKNGNT